MYVSLTGLTFFGKGTFGTLINNLAHAEMLAGPIRFKLWLISTKSMEKIT